MYTRIAALLGAVTSVFFILPNFAAAQARDVQWYLLSFTSFINDILIPFVFTLVILFLFVNITRYFIIDSADTNAREEAKKYILYAVIALVFLSSIWGVIYLFIDAFNININQRVCPDYNPTCGRGSRNSSDWRDNVNVIFPDPL